MFQKLTKPFRRYRQIKDFLERNERYLMPSLLISGLAVDVITFRSIQINTVFLLLGIYTLITGVAIFLMNTLQRERLLFFDHFLRYLRLASRFIIQFTFGALLSATLIFYWFSGSFFVSWPFILIIAFLMISNDTFRHQIMKPTVQISVYFFLTFSLLSIILPFAFHSISQWVFLLSGLLSLVFIYFYIRLYMHFHWHMESKNKTILVSVLTIFIIINSLYFSNIIPPIPLSLREADVYDLVERSGSNYVFLSEDRSLIERIIPGQTIHTQAGRNVYVYTSIFAPADLNIPIYHHWQYYDASQFRWISKGRFSFNLTGGRDAGYRGYSLKSQVPEGKWRVDAETERGQVLGRVKFRVKYVTDLPDLILRKK